MPSGRLRRVGAAVCALLALWLPAVPCAAGDAGDDPLVRRAEALIDAGRAMEAAGLLEAALAAAPGDAERYFWLGVARHRAGDRDAAREAFTRALALDPAHAAARYNLGAVAFEAGRWEAAANAFLAIPPVAPEMAAVAYLNAGLARYRQGRGEEAKALFRKAADSGPDPQTAATARRMLAVLEGPETPGPSAADTAPVPPAWAVKADLGRAFDTNVLLSPNDATSSNVSDWRTTASLRASRPVALDRWGPALTLTPDYAFYGLWYDAESPFNYRTHRLRLRLDADRPGRPRLEYGYTFAEFGGAAYMATHALSGRLQVAGSGPRAAWVTLAARRHEAPGERYEYLSGWEWAASVSGLAPFARTGTAYGSLDLRRLDAADLAGGAGEFRSYSYLAAGPLLYATHPWRFGTRVTGSLRYEYRIYRDRDTWTTPAAGSKRRRDQRVTASVQLARPLRPHLEVVASWQGQYQWSNIGDDPGDYRNRDYARNVLGLALRVPY